MPSLEFCRHFSVFFRPAVRGRIYSNYTPDHYGHPTMTEPIRGRGASENPANRFIPLNYEPAPPDPDDPGPATQFFHDASRSIVATNDSPDVGFSHSINPY